MIEAALQTFNDWTFRLRRSQEKPGRFLILVHGWRGDENSMWVFVQKLSPNYSILAPRAPFPVEDGGYSWRKIKPGTWGISSIEELRPSAEALLAFVDEWSNSEAVDATQFELIGFSQGAAMTYALTLLFPERVRRCAALSGFLPANGESLLESHRLSGKPIFIAHGSQDELIPVERARWSSETLIHAGAKVKYCESKTGHKVGKECLKEMEIFFGNF